MFIHIGSEKINAIKISRSNEGGYFIRLTTPDSLLFAGELEKNDSFTIQDGETSIIVSNLKVEYTVKWENYVDYNISTEKQATVVTKRDLDSLNEQITSLELALCELYEKQEA